MVKDSGQPVAATTGEGTQPSVSDDGSNVSFDNGTDPDPNDPIDTLSKVGGLEIAGMVGAILSAAERKIPILVDGFISTVAALVAQRLYPEVKGYLFIGHQSKEAGHQHAIMLLDKKPILNLGLRLGEGTGAALAFPILEAATNIVKEMATFESAGVAEKI